MSYQQIFGILFCAIIIYSLVKTVKLLSKKIRLRTNGFHTVATIVSFEEKKDNEETEYFPVIRFHTYIGTEVEKKIEEPRGTKPVIGKEVGIFYNPTNPEEVTIDNKWYFYINMFSILVEIYLLVYFTYFVIYNRWLFGAG